MDLIHAVKSGKRFRKPGGAWIEQLDGKLITKLPEPGRVLQIYFYPADFDLTSWELETEGGEDPKEKIETAMILFRKILEEVFLPKTYRCNHCGMNVGHAAGCVHKGAPSAL